MKTDFWRDKNVLVTGGTGFLGRHLVRQLRVFGPNHILFPSSEEADLRLMENCQKVVDGIDIVIHMAGNVGGIGYNQKFPGKLFYENLMMGAQLMEAARQANVGKFLALGTICAYPKFASIPFKEDDLWNGYPEETNAPYGLAKKMLLVQAQAYRQEYGFNAIYILPVNLYGPGDNFDLANSHVIPALIRKFVQAKDNNDKDVVVWGTGKSTREFLYVEDAAKGIIMAAEKYNGSDPVNLGSSFEISIGDLASKIKDLVGFTGKITFDTTKPDGQPRRKLDVSRAEAEIGFVSETTFDEGLKKTIDWFEKHKDKIT